MKLMEEGVATMVRQLKPDFEFNDARGAICQILSIPNSQVNYLFTKKGKKRGRHYHKENKEIFYMVSGRVKLYAEAVGNAKAQDEHTFQTGDLFLVEPLVVHDFTFLEDTQMVVVYDVGIEKDGAKDIYEVGA